MKQWALVLILLVALPVLALAQDKASSTAQATTTGTTDTATAAGTGKTGAGKDKTLTGCLNGPDSQGIYTLNTTDKKKKTISVAAGDIDLKPHVGHHVRVTGTLEAQAVPAGEAQTGEKKMKQLKVTNVEHISETCPAEGASKEATPKY